MTRSTRIRFAASLLLFASLCGTQAASALAAGLHPAPGASSTPSAGLSIPLAARTSTGVSGSGRHNRGVVHNPAAPQRGVSVRPPITVPTPLPVLPSGPLSAPGLSPLQATASSVTVQWSDRSTNELGFKVFERNDVGRWRQVYQAPTRDVRGSGDAYTWVDTSTDLSGQCYMVTAYNANAAGSSAEECTVRPDPSQFPLLVHYGQEWSGLSDTNDGTGALLNVDNNQQLRYADRTFGVNLEWANTSLWRIEAQGGPHLMKGQAVALKVWGGGWLMYGNQTWGVDLQLSDTPVYEWYAIGRRNDPSDSSWAGSDLEDGGSFALWNSSAHAYLLASYQTWGVSLNWSDQVGNSPSPNPGPTLRGVKTEQVLNCSVDQEPVEVWIADQTAGSGFVNQGTVDAQYGPDGCPAFGSMPLTFSPLSGHQYVLVATDSALSGCGSDDPQESACRKMAVQFVGDANGYTRADTVDGGTIINFRRHRPPAHGVSGRLTP